MRVTVRFVLALLSADVASAQPVRVGTNIHVSTADPKRAHYEVLVCAAPDRPGRLIVGSMVTTSEGRYGTVAYRSDDDGGTWQRTFQQDEGLNSADPACAYGRASQAYFLTMGFRGDVPRTETSLLRSDNGGQTWHPTGELPLSVDRPYVVVDRSGGPRNDHVYVHGKRDRRTLAPEREYLDNLWVARSSDGGRTFSHLDVPSLGRQIDSGRGVVLADGTLVILLGELYDTKDPTKNSIKVVRSTNGATTIQPPVRVADWGNPSSPNATRTLALAAGAAGRLHAAWEDGRTGRSEIMFSTSRDGGATWAQPIALTAVDPGSAGGFNPAIAVNGSGAVGVLWYDKRDHASDLGWGIRFAVSLDEGRSFQPSVKVSEKDVVPGPGLAQPGRFSANGGDTSGLDAQPDGAFRAVWIDNRTGVPQVWTARIEVKGGAAILQR